MRSFSRSFSVWFVIEVGSFYGRLDLNTIGVFGTVDRLVHRRDRVADHSRNNAGSIYSPYLVRLCFFSTLKNPIKWFGVVLWAPLTFFWWKYLSRSELTCPSSWSLQVACPYDVQLLIPVNSTWELFTALSYGSLLIAALVCFVCGEISEKLRSFYQQEFRSADDR